MKGFGLAIPLLSLFCVVSSCHPHGPEACPSDLSGPFPTKKSGPGERSSISFEDFYLKHQTGDALVIDARHPWFYHRGHIPGAISLPSGDNLDENLTQRMGTLQSAIARGKTLVVYCDGRFCKDARSVSRAIAKRGLDVSVFGGGWKVWQKAELSSESTSQ